MLPNNSGVLREKKELFSARQQRFFRLVGWLVVIFWVGSCPELRVAGLAGDAAAAHTSSSRSAIGFLLLAIM